MLSLNSLAALVLTLTSLTLTNASPSAPIFRRDTTGQATFYGGNLSGGMCSFTTYTLPSGIYGTAMSDSNWDGAQTCGQCVSVTGPGGNKLTAMVVDQCPGCGAGHLDLFPDAFAALAEPSKGVIDVSWNYIPCPLSGPISLHNKNGVSPYWFSMQVVNANVGVSTLEVSTDGGSSWKTTERQPYNFFEQSSGFGTAKVDVRLTSTTGEKLVVKDVTVADSASFDAGVNFSGGGSGSPAPSSSSAGSSSASGPASSSGSVSNSGSASNSVPASSSTLPTGSGQPTESSQPTGSATDQPTNSQPPPSISNSNNQAPPAPTKTCKAKNGVVTITDVIWETVTVYVTSTVGADGSEAAMTMR